MAGALVAEPLDGPAVYFLLAGDEIVYIGSSINPAFRSGCHYDKAHDAALFLPTTEAELLALERHWIGTVRPKYNKTHNPDRARRDTRTIHTAVDAAVGDALDRFMDAQPDGARLKKVTERAYKMLLEAEGFWPPPTPEPAAKRGGK